MLSLWSLHLYLHVTHLFFDLWPLLVSRETYTLSARRSRLPWPPSTLCMGDTSQVSLPVLWPVYLYCGPIKRAALSHLSFQVRWSLQRMSPCPRTTTCSQRPPPPHSCWSRPLDSDLQSSDWTLDIRACSSFKSSSLIWLVSGWGFCVSSNDWAPWAVRRWADEDGASWLVIWYLIVFLMKIWFCKKCWLNFILQSLWAAVFIFHFYTQTSCPEKFTKN